MRIVDYQPRHAEAWRTLNEAWISRLFAIEAKDRQVLDDPQGAILDKGGRIFVAEAEDGAAVGCVALLALPDGGYEVAKMTVAESLRGSGLGKRLMQACIEAGRAAGAPRLYLETNSGLGPALALYRSFGFHDLERTCSDYRRCDVQMELPLT